MADVDASSRLWELRRQVLEEQRLVRLILRLALPLFLSASVSVVYEVTDTFWLSRLGTAQLGVPTVSWPFRGILMSIAFGLSSSLSALVGQYAGAGRFGEASRSLGTVLGLLLAITVPGSLLLAVLAPFYLDLTSVPGDVAYYALVYIEVLAASTPFAAVFMAFNFALNALGDTRTPTKVSIASTLLNAVLDPILIFMLGLGVLGAALATLAANVFSAAYAAYSLATGRHGVRLGLASLAPERRLLPLVARVSGPVIAQRLGMNLGFIAMVRVVSGLGTPVVAAYSIGQVVLSFDHMISMPLARATGIIVGQSLGAGMAERAKRAARQGLLLIATAVSVYVALLLMFNKQFIALFTSDPEVAEAAHHMLVIFGPSVIGFNVFILANIVSRASGHTLLQSLLGIARLWLLRIPLSYTLAYRLGMGDTGLWAGMALSNYIVGLASGVWLLSGVWAKPVIKR